MSQKGLVPILIVLLIALALGGYLIYLQFKPKSVSVSTSRAILQPSLTSTPNAIQTITWDVPADSLSQTEEQQLKEAVGVLKIQQNQDTYLSIKSVVIKDNWALLSGQEENRTPRAVQPTGVFEFLAHKKETNWRITTPDDSNFCEMLKQAPDSIISKDYYIGCK